jgi:hypothetical protein
MIFNLCISIDLGGFFGLYGRSLHDNSLSAFIKSIANSCSCYVAFHLDRKEGTPIQKCLGNCVMFASYSHSALLFCSAFASARLFRERYTSESRWTLCFSSIERVDGRPFVTIKLLCESNIKSSDLETREDGLFGAETGLVI